MKLKNVLLVVIAVISQTTFAQVTKVLGDFSSVKVYDKLSVKLIASNENKVIINGEREKEVEVVNNNGELKLRMPFPKLLSGDAISIKLYYKNVDDVMASEGSSVSSEAVFKQTIFNLNAKEGATINLKVDAQKVNVKAVTGGIIQLSGAAANQDVVIMSGGVLKSKNLHTSQTTVTVSAGGNAEVNASTLVDAKVKAGGTISIYGKPKQINQQTILGGKIEEKE
ncbi:head GIN domain-containing protein [Flavobacterium daejeonense]|uniref:head GIN domain-containing protein n=1 Tax=Flavobacterium daejeonense TaxID=350893 RepID=UPI00054D5AC9|nr:head GIN domain-containing protein [Flavobacterium daejeonense]